MGKFQIDTWRKVAASVKGVVATETTGQGRDGSKMNPLTRCWKSEWMETDRPHAPSVIGQLKILAYFKNKIEIGLLWLFKSRQIVSAIIYFFAVTELLLPEAGGLKQTVPAVSRTIHVYMSTLYAHFKKDSNRH